MKTLQTFYIKVTIPALPESVRVSINSVMHTGSAEQCLKIVRREAAKRAVAAEYELSTREEYLAFRKAQREAIEAHAAKGGVMIQLTPREALAIQAKQVAHYAPNCPTINLALLVTGLTDLTGLEMDTMYSVVEINRHIPRGGAIGAIIAKATRPAKFRTVEESARVWLGDAS